MEQKKKSKECVFEVFFYFDLYTKRGIKEDAKEENIYSEMM